MKPPSASSSVTKVPGIGRSLSATSSSSGPAPAVPRTVTSASLRSTTSSNTSKPSGRLGLSASRVNSSTSSSTPTQSGTSKKLGGLKATKAAAPIDFEKAQREAEAEEERIRQLGYDRKREEEEAKAAKLAEEAAKANAARDKANEVGGPAKSGLDRSGSSKLVGHQKGNSQDMSRLGMGMKRLGLGTAASPAVTSKLPYVQ